MVLVSLIPLLILVVVLYVRNLRAQNKGRRTKVLQGLGLSELHTKKLIGFFHPYWCVHTTHMLSDPYLVFNSVSYSNAGGGGERVLWTAIAALQRTEPDIVSVVYSGDIDATKDEIIAKVKVRTLFLLYEHTRPNLRVAGTLRHRVGPIYSPFRFPKIEGPRRRFRVATFYVTRSESRVHVPRLGGYVYPYT